MLLQWTSKFISSLAVHRAGTREEVPRIEAKPDDALKLVSAQVGANEAEIFVRSPRISHPTWLLHAYMWSNR